jgi:mycothiol synthase
MAELEIKIGAAGIVFGRNVIQSPKPIQLQKALIDVLKNKMSAKEAAKNTVFERKCMSDERILPQLVMKRPHLRNLPKIELPTKYAIRSFKEGDENSWNRIIRASFDNLTYDFNQEMKGDESFRPERVLFVTYYGEPVATASAWYRKQYGLNTGYLHMVGVSHEHQGKHLGYWVSVAVLHQLVIENRDSAVLQTDDFRLPAIRTYLQMEFEPVIFHENLCERWWNIFKAIDRSDLVAQFDPILSGPLVNIP